MSRKKDILLLLAAVAPPILLVAPLFYESGGTALLAIAHWFDPVFVQYNLTLLLFATLIIPLVTYFYTTHMKGQKRRRLKEELPPSLWEQAQETIQDAIDRQFRMSNYWGSMMVLVVLVTIGSSILLLLKPLPLKAIGSTAVAGLDYNRGANFLVLGPYIQSFLEGRTEEYYAQLTISLAAFQFGFLGAYVYFVGHLMRSYFTLDLTPNTFVIGSIRIVVGSLLALVLGFALPMLPYVGSGSAAHESLRAVLPMLGFAIGYFPSRAFLLIEKLAGRILTFAPQEYASTSLTALGGMSYSHELRLQSEGYDNIDNLAHADPLDLALRTGFAYQQLRQWIGESILRIQLGRDFDAFRAATGIHTSHDFAGFVARWDTQEGEDAYDYLAKATGRAFDAKLRIAGALLVDNRLSPV